jgi:hypothetical protein
MGIHIFRSHHDATVCVRSESTVRDRMRGGGDLLKREPYFVYVGTYADQARAGIRQLRFDPESGALSPAGSISGKGEWAASSPVFGVPVRAVTQHTHRGSRRAWGSVAVVRVPAGWSSNSPMIA